MAKLKKLIVTPLLAALFSSTSTLGIPAPSSGDDPLLYFNPAVFVMGPQGIFFNVSLTQPPIDDSVIVKFNSPGHVFQYCRIRFTQKTFLDDYDYSIPVTVYARPLPGSIPVPGPVSITASICLDPFCSSDPVQQSYFGTYAPNAGLALTPEEILPTKTCPGDEAAQVQALSAAAARFNGGPETQPAPQQPLAASLDTERDVQDDDTTSTEG